MSTRSGVGAARSTLGIRVAAILQRNPLIERPKTIFQNAYWEYTDQDRSEKARCTFDIMTEHKRELAKYASVSMGDQGKKNGSETKMDVSKSDAGIAGETEGSMDPVYVKADMDPSCMDIRRKLDRKLYFVVSDDRGRWLFPWNPRLVKSPRADEGPTGDTEEINPDSEGDTANGESEEAGLHQDASRALTGILGDDWERMEIGRMPVAMYVRSNRESRLDTVYETTDRPRRPIDPNPKIRSDPLRKPIPPWSRVNPPTFFFKSQVVSGRMLFKPSAAFRSYKWCTKEELQSLLEEEYYNAVSRVLSE
jgi:hypothetical protein